jgi:hypothetical protein
MPYPIEQKLVIAVASSALFDLTGPEILDVMLANGAERARLIAAPTLERVKRLMGLLAA